MKPLTAIIVAVMFSSTVAAGDAIRFDRDVRPVLSEYCYACHGPDKNHREAELRLDDRESVIDHGAIVAGRPDESPLIDRILSADPDLVMPPPKTGKKLSADQQKLLTDWIRGGAEYQKHWSFEPVAASVPIPDAGGDWARNAIDHFAAEAHIAHQLTPSPEADRAVWLRRVSFDLTGLPPSLAERDAFLADDSADAYETVVERLLASPAYGERMANMWLDVARYADTFGYQNDVAMEVWPWRDWVIGAFNRNLPYDRFLTEQIAGDLLPNATSDQQLATTFNRLHRQTNEGGSIAEEFRLTGIADRTTTAGTAFLGLTLECCRCHEHKFDPIEQREFYQLSAYFSDIDEFGLYSHFTFAQPTPAMLLYKDNQRESHEAALAEVRQAESAYRQALAAARRRWEEHSETLNTSLPEVRAPVLHMSLEGTADGIVGTATECDGDQQIVCEGAPEFGRTSPFTFSLWVRPAVQQPRMLVLHQSVAAEDSGFRGLQLTIDDGRPEFSMIHFWPGNAVRIQTRGTIPLNEWTQIAFTHDGSGTAAGLTLFVNGKPAVVDIERDKLTRDIRHRKEWGDMSVGKVKLALGARFRDVGFRGGLVDELQVFDVELTAAEVRSLFHQVSAGTDSGVTTSAARNSAAAGNSAADAETMSLDGETALMHELLTRDESVRAAREKLQQARDHEDEVMTDIRQIMVMRHSDSASPTFVLRRGDYTAKAEQVTPAVPAALGDIPAGDDRLELAHWMTDRRNPLTSRVIVNRMWHLFFGRGIVNTLEDFGAQGTPPSHPELLDYLAGYLMDNHWDLHQLCREIVLSATYRQSSAVHDAVGAKSDPDNIWLARGPRHRLSAEQLRDSVLSASGLLVREIGGPSVMPYQPAGLWEEAGTGKSYHQSTGAGLYRRSLYTFWRRTAPPPSMLTFDATSRESCTARRELTNTPLQALVLLNDPQFVEAARVLAEHLLKNHSDNLNDRWDELFRRVISRIPDEQERRVISELYREQLAYFRRDESQAAELLTVGATAVNGSLDRADLAATTVVVQTLFAFDEAIMLR
ncbi:MAG: DUF1553 domain-containing protein [Planctomycetaceae bacterium]|nr:DUF1553 domain-containing protein [Planctomycetaceae bacterium]